MKIAVLGGGNGCYAAAADLAEAGHEVRFWRRDAAAFAPTLAAQAIELKDRKGTRTVKLAKATTDIGEAIKGAELIVIATPAFAQEDIARAMAPHLVTGQVVYLPPGTFGGYIMARIVRDSGNAADVAWAENGTLPWLCRKHGPNLVAISVRAVALPSGVFPLRLAEHAHKAVKAAFPADLPGGDGLAGALLNAGPIIHPPLIMLNAGPLEHFPAWDIHNEGTQPSIRRVTTALDNERIAMRTALGYGDHWPLADHYDPDSNGWMYGKKSHDALTDSNDWREKIPLTSHRYMIEDVACGLAFLVSVADWTKVPAPTATGLLAIASAIVGRDLRATGRTLENLGLARKSRAEMAALLKDGL